MIKIYRDSENCRLSIDGRPVWWGFTPYLMADPSVSKLGNHFEINLPPERVVELWASKPKRLASFWHGHFKRFCLEVYPELEGVI